MSQNKIPKHPAALYFNELAPLENDGGERCALFGHFYLHPDVPLTRVVVATPNLGWAVVNDTDVPDIICGADYSIQDGNRQIFSVFRHGETFIYQGTNRTEIPKPTGVGFLSGVKKIGKNIYTCGSQNAIYQFDGKKWNDFSQNLRVKYSGPDDPILNSIDGFSENDIYVVGYNGSIFHFDGKQWLPVKSPTDDHLHQVLCHSDGKVYICGRNGSLFKGDKNGWENLNSTAVKDDFWSLSSFNEEVYTCTMRKLFKITHKTLSEVVVPVNSSGTFSKLGSNSSYFWATTGTGHILRFDKENWIELLWPDSV